ncbi:hypothetical protein MSZK_33530 [Mycobacterium sp. shizuoka-1]|nr:hypothetical protein MSZK_33530 [Mycobacterium sp. shizuoka-1]
MVSPGLKVGMSSRSDAWSTKSSVFIGDTSLRFAAQPTHLRKRAGSSRADGFGHVVFGAAGGSKRVRPARQLLNCARCSASNEIARPAAATDVYQLANRAVYKRYG